MAHHEQIDYYSAVWYAISVHTKFEWVFQGRNLSQHYECGFSLMLETDFGIS